MKKFGFALISLIVAPQVMAAACCGGGASFPSLILGDDRAQVAFSSSYASVIGDAPASGRPVFRAGSDDETVLTQQLDAAHIVGDRWQVGASVPLVHRARTTPDLAQSGAGLGDVSYTAAYEVLPEWSFSSWKPRGFVFAQMTFPTGGSVYETEDAFAVKARGRGFYTPAVGVYLLKIAGKWDFSFRGRAGHSLDRVFSLQDGSGSELYVRPSWNFGSALNVGYNPANSDWRLGLGLETLFEASNNVASKQWVWNSSVDVSRVFLKTWSVTVAYNDQTLFGPARNVSLSRTMALSLRHRWER